MSEERIDVCDGKYTVVIDGGNLSALRYGETWQDLTGNNLVYWLAVELREARAAVQAAPAECDHQWAHFGTEQRRRRCNLCNEVEPAAPMPMETELQIASDAYRQGYEHAQKDAAPQPPDIEAAHGIKVRP